MEEIRENNMIKNLDNTDYLDNVITTEIITDKILSEVDYVLKLADGDLNSVSVSDSDDIFEKIQHDICDTNTNQTNIENNCLKNNCPDPVQDKSILNDFNCSSKNKIVVSVGNKGCLLETNGEALKMIDENIPKFTSTPLISHKKSNENVRLSITPIRRFHDTTDSGIGSKNTLENSVLKRKSQDIDYPENKRIALEENVFCDKPKKIIEDFIDDLIDDQNDTNDSVYNTENSSRICDTKNISPNPESDLITIDEFHIQDQSNNNILVKDVIEDQTQRRPLKINDNCDETIYLNETEFHNLEMIIENDLKKSHTPKNNSKISLTDRFKELTKTSPRLITNTSKGIEITVFKDSKLDHPSKIRDENLSTELLENFKRCVTLSNNNTLSISLSVNHKSIDRRKSPVVKSLNEKFKLMPPNEKTYEDNLLPKNKTPNVVLCRNFRVIVDNNYFKNDSIDYSVPDDSIVSRIISYNENNSEKIIQPFLNFDESSERILFENSSGNSSNKTATENPSNIEILPGRFNLFKNHENPSNPSDIPSISPGELLNSNFDRNNRDFDLSKNSVTNQDLDQKRNDSDDEQDFDSNKQKTTNEINKLYKSMSPEFGTKTDENKLIEKSQETSSDISDSINLKDYEDSLDELLKDDSDRSVILIPNEIEIIEVSSDSDFETEKRVFNYEKYADVSFVDDDVQNKPDDNIKPDKKIKTENIIDLTTNEDMNIIDVIDLTLNQIKQFGPIEIIDETEDELILELEYLIREGSVRCEDGFVKKTAEEEKELVAVEKELAVEDKDLAVEEKKMVVEEKELIVEKKESVEENVEKKKSIVEQNESLREKEENLCIEPQKNTGVEKKNSELENMIIRSQNSDANKILDNRTEKLSEFVVIEDSDVAKDNSDEFQKNPSNNVTLHFNGSENSSESKISSPFKIIISIDEENYQEISSNKIIEEKSNEYPKAVITIPSSSNKKTKCTKTEAVRNFQKQIKNRIESNQLIKHNVNYKKKCFSKKQQISMKKSKELRNKQLRVGGDASLNFLSRRDNIPLDFTDDTIIFLNTSCSLENVNSSVYGTRDDFYEDGDVANETLLPDGDKHDILDLDKTITPTNISDSDKTVIENKNFDFKSKNLCDNFEYKNIPLSASKTVSEKSDVNNSIVKNVDTILSSKIIDQNISENSKLENVPPQTVSENKISKKDIPSTSKSGDSDVIDLVSENPVLDNEKINTFKPVLENKVFDIKNIPSSSKTVSEPSNVPSTSVLKNKTPIINVKNIPSISKPSEKSVYFNQISENKKQRLKRRASAEDIERPEVKKQKLQNHIIASGTSRDDTFMDDITDQNFTRLLFNSQKTIDENDPNWMDIKDLVTSDEFFKHVNVQWRSDTLPNPQKNLTKRFVTQKPLVDSGFEPCGYFSVLYYLNNRIKNYRQKISNIEHVMRRHAFGKKKRRSFVEDIEKYGKLVENLEKHKEEVMQINKFYVDYNTGWDALYLNSIQFDDLQEQDETFQMIEQFYK